jgi:HEAT repeat protein
VRRRPDATERLRAVQASRSSRALIESLDEPSPEVARAAVRRIEEIDGQSAVDALRARLLTADLSLVADIAKALRRIGDSRAVDLAIAGLTGEPYTRRLAAATALGALADARGTFMLRIALQDAIAGVRVAALDALAQIAPATDEAGACARPQPAGPSCSGARGGADRERARQSAVLPCAGQRPQRAARSCPACGDAD